MINEMSRYKVSLINLPRGLSGKEFACQCRNRKSYRFDPWVEKIP